MEDMKFMPGIKFNGITFGVLAIHFCVDFGGRQAQIETQRVDNKKIATFVYHWIPNNCGYWTVEEVLLENQSEVAFLEQELTVGQNQPIFKMIEGLFDAHADKTREEVKKETGYIDVSI